MASQPNTAATTKTTYKIDPNHSFLEFSGRHMVVSVYKGRFSGVSGTIDLDLANPTESSVEAVVDATTVYTGSDQRDGHIKTADFLDIENHPTLTFKSRRVESSGGESAKVVGDLTIRGTTHELTFDVEYLGQETNPYGTKVLGFEAKSSFSRKDFGLTFNAPLASGGFVLGDTIKIEIHIEANP